LEIPGITGSGNGLRRRGSDLGRGRRGRFDLSSLPTGEHGRPGQRADETKARMIGFYKQEEFRFDTY